MFSPTNAINDAAAAAIESHGSATIESFIALLSVATAVGVISHKIKIPYTVALVVAGIAMNALGLVPEFGLTPDLLLMVFLPALLFEAAIHFPSSELKQFAPTIVTLAALGVVLTAAVTALLLELGFNTLGVSLNISFIHFLLFGTIIAATDPISVITLFRQLGVDRRLAIMLEGESLFNDGTAIVLFMVVLEAIVSGSFSFSQGVIRFVTFAMGGIFLGSILGLFSSLAIKFSRDHLTSIAITTITAYGSYIVAENFHSSGVLATVSAGLFVGNIGKKKGMSPNERLAVVSFWEYIAFFVSSIVFLMIGLEVNLMLLVDNYALVLLATFAVLASRAVAIYLPLPFLQRVGQDISLKRATAIWWGGLRGSLSMVLALSLPTSLAARDTIIAMTFGVVVVSVILQGSTMGLLVRWLKLVDIRSEAMSFLGKSLARLAAINAKQKAVSQLVAQGFQGVSVSAMRLHEERTAILAELEERQSDPEMQIAASKRQEFIEHHLKQVARDSYKDSLETNLITEEEAIDLTSKLESKESLLSENLFGAHKEKN